MCPIEGIRGTPKGLLTCFQQPNAAVKRSITFGRTTTSMLATGSHWCHSTVQEHLPVQQLGTEE
jgi:hypothetical protein